MENISWYLDNKYTKWYFDIIDKAKIGNRSKKRGYYERHHVIPRFVHRVKGFRVSDIVLLTAREHFICHLLLRKMVKTDKHRRSAAFALFLMSKVGTYRVYSSRHFENLKGDISIAMRTEKLGSKNPNFGKRRSKETIEKIAASNTGKKRSKQSIETQRQALVGKKLSSAHKEKISNTMKSKGINVGSSNPMFGQSQSESAKKAIGEAARLQKWTDERRKKIADAKRGRPNPACKRKMVYGRLIRCLASYFDLESIFTASQYAALREAKEIKVSCTALKVIEYLPEIEGLTKDESFQILHQLLDQSVIPPS